MFQLFHENQTEKGFTLIEVTVAMFVLTVGFLGLAALTASLLASSQQSKDMSLAALLASEKLEDLNRWSGSLPAPSYADPSSADPQICVQAGDTQEGSLTQDILQTTTCPSSLQPASISYYDDISIDLSNNSGNCANPTWGCLSETVSAISGGNTVYTTTYHSPDGQINTPAASTTAPGYSSFHRRWLIEANTPVNGVRRVTVLVTCLDPTLRVPVNFQMSVVRP